MRGGYARHGRTPINGRPSPPASNSGLGLVIYSCCRHLKTVFPPFCFVSLARHGLGLEVSLFLFRTTEERLTFLIFSSSSSSSFSLLLRNTRAARFACRGDRNFWLEYLCSLFAGTKRDSKDLGRHGKKNFPRLYKQFSNQLRSEGKGSSSPNATAGFVCAACVCLEKKREKKRRREEEGGVFLSRHRTSTKNSLQLVSHRLLLSYSFSSRALCSCVKSRREKEKKKDLRLSKKEIENKEKCREPKFGRSQGKAKTSFLLRPTQRRLCCAPPLPEKAGHALPGKKGARARRRAGREAPRYRGEGKEKCKRPAGNGEGGQKKSDDEKLPLSLSRHPGSLPFVVH